MSPQRRWRADFAAGLGQALEGAYALLQEAPPRLCRSSLPSMGQRPVDADEGALAGGPPSPCRSGIPRRCRRFHPIGSPAPPPAAGPRRSPSLPRAPPLERRRPCHGQEHLRVMVRQRARAAARFYARFSPTAPCSRSTGAVRLSWARRRRADVEISGGRLECLGLNGGDAFHRTEASRPDPTENRRKPTATQNMGHRRGGKRLRLVQGSLGRSPADHARGCWRRHGAGGPRASAPSTHDGDGPNDVAASRRRSAVRASGFTWNRHFVFVIPRKRCPKVTRASVQGTARHRPGPPPACLFGAKERRGGTMEE